MDRKERIKINFKNWMSIEDNKFKMKEYMRNYMRKRNKIKEENYKIKE